jgi:hypothetical protein
MLRLPVLPINTVIQPIIRIAPPATTNGLFFLSAFRSIHATLAGAILRAGSYANGISSFSFNPGVLVGLASNTLILSPMPRIS